MDAGPSHKKRAKRIQQKFTTKLRLYQDQFARKKSAAWDIVTIRNFSSSGILFNYNAKLPIKTEIELKIILPCAQDIYCRGIVCRIVESPSFMKMHNKFAIYGIAAKFVELDPSTKILIDRFIEEYKPELVYTYNNNYHQ